MTPPFLRGREIFMDDLEDKIPLGKLIKKFPLKKFRIVC